MTDTVIYTLPRQRVSGYHEGTKFTAVSDVVTHEMNEENSCEKMYYFTSISGIPNWCTPHTFYLSFTLHVCSPPHKFTPPDFFCTSAVSSLIKSTEKYDYWRASIVVIVLHTKYRAISVQFFTTAEQIIYIFITQILIKLIISDRA